MGSRYKGAEIDAVSPKMCWSHLIPASDGEYAFVVIGDLVPAGHGILIESINLYGENANILFGTIAYPGPYTWTPIEEVIFNPFSGGGIEHAAWTNYPTYFDFISQGVFQLYTMINDVDIYIKPGTYMAFATQYHNRDFAFMATGRIVSGS